MRTTLAHLCVFVVAAAQDEAVHSFTDSSESECIFRNEEQIAYYNNAVEGDWIDDGEVLAESWTPDMSV